MQTTLHLENSSPAAKKPRRHDNAPPSQAGGSDDDNRGPEYDQAMRRQAADQLALAIGKCSELKDGRRTQLYALVRAIGVYVAHDLLAECEVRTRFFEAARANGSLQKYDAPWAAKTIRSALIRGGADSLPPLDPEYHSEIASA
jgi:hypothetical protein